MKKTIKMAFVGCGFVSDYYMRTLKYYPDLELIGVYDRNMERTRAFSSHYSIPGFETLEDLLRIGDLDLVVNLTTPESHYEVSKKILQAGKHLYSEKPFTLNTEHSEELVMLAQKNDLLVSGAPCSVLGANAQEIRQQIEKQVIGAPRLVYIEMEDGPIHLMGADMWTNDFGVPWPVDSEFEMGSSLEHLGYAISWALYLFGAVSTSVSATTCVLPEKKVGGKIFSSTDFSVAVLTHKSGVVTRITCGIAGPMNRSIMVVGDGGYLEVEDIWDNQSPVKRLKFEKIRLKAARKKIIANNWLGQALFGLNPKKVSTNTKRFSQFGLAKNNMKMDYLLGVNDLAQAILSGTPPKLSAEFLLEVNALTLQINEGDVVRVL